jgi:hypothetical protein
VTGSVLLLTGYRNEPLGLRNAPARTSSSSLPSPYPTPKSRTPSSAIEDKKKTKDGAIILEPQPDDSHNDPLNWATWRRDSALLSLGFYCMVGGGMTPILAAGFTDVAQDFNVTVPKVALTTGLYMMGLGIGSVFASPTAILYGKRPVYLASAILFIATSIWCADSPSYTSLIIARILQGMSISPVECLPSATIAEIFFLHERAYRLGIYTLLLLGGKNLVPLVSAVIIQALSWRWVFWYVYKTSRTTKKAKFSRVVAMVVGLCWILLFFFVPETFWDRTPRPKLRRPSHEKLRHSHEKLHSSIFGGRNPSLSQPHNTGEAGDASTTNAALYKTSTSKSANDTLSKSLTGRRPSRALHVGFAPEGQEKKLNDPPEVDANNDRQQEPDMQPSTLERGKKQDRDPIKTSTSLPTRHDHEDTVKATGLGPPTPASHNFNSPPYAKFDATTPGFPFRSETISDEQGVNDQLAQLESNPPVFERPPGPVRYTTFLKQAPRRTFTQELKPWNGRLHHDNWFRVAIRPFILFAYPSVLWSAVVYACSVGWLIVLSESVAAIYRNSSTYNFSALSTGLIYLSPFIGGILGTAVAGKVSDVIVRAMARRNGGLYEPEFRLVMAIPIAISTVIGLMGFGWAAEVHDAWIVPTIFFGVISFGCSLGSTTAITFCVDSYRPYAGEALVTLNFSKNVFHGLVFSLFFNTWLEADGSKRVFVALGGIQLALMLMTIPLYIYGKRARMWTVRKNFMEKF